MARIIAIANQKGGVGKTTTCASLAVALSQLRKNILAVDLDPQGHLSISLGLNGKDLEKTIYQAMLQRGVSLDSVLLKARKNLTLAPANRDLAASEIILVEEAKGERILSKLLNKVKDKYDYILIDCPPSLGKLTINALTAADEVIIPVECSFLALKGLGELLSTIELIKQRLNPNLKVRKVLATMYDARTLHAQEVVERLKSIFKERFFAIPVVRSVRFREAPVRGQTILEYAPHHKGAFAYRRLAKEVIGE